MPLIDADYDWFHSTGKKGGAKTATPWQNGVKGDLFDKFDPAETLAGGVFFACVFFENGNGTILMEDIKMFISQITPSDDTEIAIALTANGIDSAAEVIADEIDSTNQLSGLTFSAPVTKGTGLAPANLPAGSYIGVWFALTIDAAAAAKANDGWTISTYAAYTE